jgi:succinyl-CoA:acetate CoA-transferase
MDYIDMHLSHVAQQTWFGIGDLDTAIVEVSAIREDGRLVPSTSVGNNKTWLDLAKKVIIEVNLWRRRRGRHARCLLRHRAAAGPQADPLVHGRPHRRALPALRSGQGGRGGAHQRPDRNSPFSPADENSTLIAGHLIEFLKHQVAKGYLPRTCCRCSPAWATSPTRCWPGWPPAASPT